MSVVNLINITNKPFKVKITVDHYYELTVIIPCILINSNYDDKKAYI